MNHTKTNIIFHSKFWHQNLQLNLEGPARFATYNVLRLSKGTLIARYTLVFFIFFISGCWHILTDLGSNLPPSQSGALRFFCTQALGIMLEDGAQEFYRRLASKRQSLKADILRKCVGYVWVLAFLSWSTACWQYPAIRIAKREDTVLGWSDLRSLGPPSSD